MEQPYNTGGQSCGGPREPYPIFASSWESDTESVATVDNSGLATGISGGYASISCYWTGFVYVWDDLDESCDVFEEPIEPSTPMTVVQITLQKGDGSTLPSPLRVGVTANGHDRKQQLRAVVDPAAEAANVTISVSGKLSSSDVSTSSGVITFKVVGTMESGSKGDQTITATHSAGMTTTHPVTVVIPRKIGTSHPTFSGTVTGENRRVSRTSTPPFPDVPPGREWLLTFYARTLDVPVTDKWDDPIGSLYAGATITEGGIDIKVTLTTASTYPDIVGTAVPRDYPLYINYLPTDPIAVTWPTDSPKALPLAASATQTIAVEVDGFSLSPAVAGRTWTATPPNSLVITWP